MAFTNSPMITYAKLSPNHSGQRRYPITRITPHCVVGQLSVEALGDIFYNRSRNASCNYGIGADGRIGLYCEEKNRSWCSSNSDNDNRAITIECASDTKHPYAFNDKVYNKLIDLCVDICKRNGKTKIIWFGDRNKTLTYKPLNNEMVLTVHRWFANKECPGDWLMSRMDDLANKVNIRLGNKPINNTEINKFPYKVKIITNDLNVREKPDPNSKITAVVHDGEVYTIIQEEIYKNSKWGKLKSGRGYINLKYTKEF